MLRVRDYLGRRAAPGERGEGRPGFRPGEGYEGPLQQSRQFSWAPRRVCRQGQ